LSQAETMNAPAPADTSTNALGAQMTMGKFAMWSFLASDAMGFAGFFAAFVASRRHGVWVWDEEFSSRMLSWPDPTHWFAIDLTALNTFILICSSVTMVKALSACHRDDRAGLLKFLGMTILGGLFFLGVQVVEYTHLVHDNITPSVDNFGGTFYSLTCYHGLHVLSGVIYLICIFIGALRGKYGAKNSMPIEIVGLFWHFVDLVWILLFTFVYLLQPLADQAA
jgi:cytochrome c oxidase subunit III